MILPERVLGSSATTMICRGRAIGPISLATWSRSSLTTSGPPSPASLRRMTNAQIACPVMSSAAPDDGRLGDLRVGHQRGLDLGRRHPVAGDVHDVVDPAEQPEVAVVVLLRAVAGEVAAGEARPVGLLVALVVAPQGAQHRRPRLGQDEVAARRRRAPELPSSSTTSALTPGSGVIAAPGFPAVTPGQRADHDRAGLGLPPGVDDRAAVAADGLAVPDVRLGVDRLPDAARSAAASTGRTCRGSPRPTS